MRARRWRQGVISLLSVGAVAVASLVWSQTALAASSTSAFSPFTPATRPKPSNEPLYLPTASPWLQLTNAPPAGFFPGSMMVMTDGTVLIHEDNTGRWEKLTPSSTGSYTNGTWSAVASMPSGYQPEYYASQILPTGQLLVDGGEYNGSNTEVWTTLGAIYNPITNTWASVSPPTGWLNTGDAQSEMLPTASGGVWTSGIFMLAHPFADGSSGGTGMDDALFNTNGTWTKIPGTGKLDRNDEEGWTLLPNGRVLTVDIEHNWNGTDGGTCSPCTSEVFNPLNDTWSATGNVPVTFRAMSARPGRPRRWARSSCDRTAWRSLSAGTTPPRRTTQSPAPGRPARRCRATRTARTAQPRSFPTGMCCSTRARESLTRRRTSLCGTARRSRRWPTQRTRRPTRRT